MSPDHWAMSAGLVATSALALIANALLLLVFCRRRGLRTVSNRFVINLLFTNLLSSILLIPLLLVDQELLQSSSFEQHSTLLMENDNNSARMEIENINLEHRFPFRFISKINNHFTEKVELPKIRHFEHHLLKIRKNESFLDEFPSTFHNNNNNSNEAIERQQKDATGAATTFLCYLSGGSTNLVCTASILSILLIAIDQYFAVTHPLRYHAFIDKLKSVILLVSTWLISLVFGILGAFVQTDSTVWNFCVAPQNENFQNWYNIFFAFTYLFLVILVPFLIICVIYGCIYCAAHRNSERMRKSNSGSSNTNLEAYIQLPLGDDHNKLKVKVNSSDNVMIAAAAATTKTTMAISSNEKDNILMAKLPKVKSAPNLEINIVSKVSDECCTRILSSSASYSHANTLRSNASFINSLRTKISNASLFKYREETRAAKISILVIFMVLVCYVPYGFTLVMNTDVIVTSPRYFNCVSLSLLVCANFLSPFLFAYRNRRIQRELRRLFGLLPSSGKRSARELKVVAGSGINRHRMLTTRAKTTCCNSQLQEQQIIDAKEPFLTATIPEVVVTCKETEKKSILKRVCSKGKTWGTVKKCNFISVPECLSTECRCSFSSASTQVSSEEYSICN